MTLLSTVLQNDTVKVLVLGNQRPVIEYFKDPSTIIAVIAVFVTLLGLWISASYSRQTLEHTIKHNKLSVEPILRIPYEVSHSNYTISIEMYNSGIGTALIKKFTLIYENKIFDNFNILLNAKTTFTYRLQYFTFPTVPNTVALSTTNKMCLFNIKLDTKREFSEVYELLLKTKYDIEYETMYGDKRVYNNAVI